MSEAEANPEEGQTPGEEQPVNEENNNAEVDPNDPMTGYKEDVPGGGGEA